MDTARGTYTDSCGVIETDTIFRSQRLDLIGPCKSMTLDADKIDEAVLALLLLGRHDGARAWKGFDWDAMNRLYEKGYISDPRGKAKSVVFSEEGIIEAERLLKKMCMSEK